MPFRHACALPAASALYPPRDLAVAVPDDLPRVPLDHPHGVEVVPSARRRMAEGELWISSRSAQQEDELEEFLLRRGPGQAAEAKGGVTSPSPQLPSERLLKAPRHGNYENFPLRTSFREVLARCRWKCSSSVSRATLLETYPERLACVEELIEGMLLKVFSEELGIEGKEVVSLIWLNPQPRAEWD